MRASGGKPFSKGLSENFPPIGAAKWVLSLPIAY